MDEKAILLEALAIDSPDERAAYLDRACADRPALRRRIDALLRWDSQDDPLFDHPLFETQHLETGDPDDANLDFLEPSARQDSLGLLGHYEILGVLGRGATGIVLKGFDANLNRMAALKVLAPEIARNATARRRFVREAQSAAAVVHPNVITIYSVDHSGKLPYLAMECIVGKTLQQKIDDEGALPVESVTRIGTQIAHGLAAAHEQGLIHRDIKPANILLENNVERVRITDFGLARAVDDAAATGGGHVAGTPQYMSPEQARGEELDHRSDLFSLGCVLYAMCTGRSPFRADTTIAAIRRVCEDSPRPLQEANPDVPGWLARLIETLLDKRPDQRIQSAGEVADLLAGKTVASRDLAGNPDRSTRRNVAVALAAVVLLVGSFLASERLGLTRATNLHGGANSGEEPRQPPDLDRPTRGTNDAAVASRTAASSPPTTAVVPPEKRPVKVFILAGDSAMFGPAKVSLLEYQATRPETASLFAHLRKNNDWIVRNDVWIKQGQQHGKLTVGYGRDSNRFGPELEFGRVVGDHFDEQVLLIKSCAPGSNLCFSMRSPSAALLTPEQVEPFLDYIRESHPNLTSLEAVQRAGVDYRQMLVDVRGTLADLDAVFPENGDRGYEVSGLVLFLSWLDFTFFTDGKAYTRDLADFVRDVRKDLNAPGMPIVIGQCGCTPEPDQLERMKEFKSVQAAVANVPEFKGNVSVVPTDVYWDADAEAVYNTGWREHIEEWNKVGSDPPYNYLGSAKTFAKIGEAFGEAIVALTVNPRDAASRRSSRPSQRP